MPATYDELATRALNATGRNYTPAYEEEYRARMQKRYGEEIPAAQAMREAAQSGEMSAQQGLDLGQNMAGQVVAGVGGQAAGGRAVGAAMAGRAAQYAGGAGALQASQQAAQIGQRALEGAQSEELDARMRQVTYGQQLQQEELRRKALLEQALRARYAKEKTAQEIQDEEDARAGNAAMAAGKGIIDFFAQKMSGGSSPVPGGKV